MNGVQIHAVVRPELCGEVSDFMRVKERFYAGVSELFCEG